MFTRFSATAAASLPWGLIKAGVGGVASLWKRSVCVGGGEGGHLVGVNMPLGVDARRETRCDLYSTR